MILGYHRGVQSEGAFLEFAFLHLLLEEAEDILVLVELIGADVDDEVQLVGHYVMLCASLYHGDAHLRASQQPALLPELIVAQPYQVVEGFIDCVHTLIASRMT